MIQKICQDVFTGNCMTNKIPVDVMLLLNSTKLHDVIQIAKKNFESNIIKPIKQFYMTAGRNTQ